MNVLILAAGLGTRLRPLTESTPKPLVPIVDKTILEHQLDLAKTLGNVSIHVNAHYLSDQIEAQAKILGIEKVWVEQPALLGTAGPLYRIFDNAYRGGLLVMNSDCFCDFDLKQFVENAQNSKADISLLGVDFLQANTLQVELQNEHAGFLTGIKNQWGEISNSSITFSGVSYYSDSALSRLKKDEFDIRKFWKQETETSQKIFVDLSQKNNSWLDMGSPAGLKKATEKRLQKLGTTSWVHPLAKCSKNQIENSVVQEGVFVPENALIKNSILFKGAQITSGEIVENQIRGNGFSWNI